MGRSLVLITALNSKTFKKIFIGGGRWLTLHRRFLNRLNVYPVPDGDTGTNMSLTIRGALRALAYGSGAETVGQAAQRAASGALWEAHGNSGVIFSQILHGFASSLSDKKEASIQDLTAALRQSATFAYRSLSHPAEGTILSFIRILAEQAELALEQEERDLVSFLSHILRQSQYFFDINDNDERPQALRQAKVVDAGALGLYFFLAGMLRIAQSHSLSGGEVDSGEVAFIERLKFSIANFIPVIQTPAYQYCSEFLLADYPPNLRSKIEAELAPWGDSLVMAQTPKLLKIHLHTDVPQIVNSILLRYGRLIDSKKDDLTKQCQANQKAIWGEGKGYSQPPSYKGGPEIGQAQDHFTHIEEKEESKVDLLPSQSRSIQIITDSTCDLSLEYLQTLGVVSVPLRINLNGRSYLDGLNLNSQQLVELLNQGQEGVEISTSHPSPHDFAKLYSSFSDRSIISLHPSLFLSGSYNAACQAARSLDPEQKRIKVINSNSVSIGLGCLITETARFIAANPQATLATVSKYTESLANKIHLLFTVPSLQYLIQGGRLRTPKQKLERLSQAYHIFSYSGELSIAPLARSLNLKRALEDIAQRVKLANQQRRVSKIFLVFSPNLKSTSKKAALDISQAIALLSQELDNLNLPAPIFTTETGCAVSVHCGSGALGIAYLTD